LRFFALLGVLALLLPVTMALFLIPLSHMESAAFSSVLTGDLANKKKKIGDA